jgi:hypothetical protein
VIWVMRPGSLQGKKSQSSILNKPNIEGQNWKKKQFKKKPKTKKKQKKHGLKLTKNKMTRHL